MAKIAPSCDGAAQLPVAYAIYVMHITFLHTASVAAPAARESSLEREFA